MNHTTREHSPRTFGSSRKSGKRTSRPKMRMILPFVQPKETSLPRFTPKGSLLEWNLESAGIWQLDLDDMRMKFLPRWDSRIVTSEPQPEPIKVEIELTLGKPTILRRTWNRDEANHCRLCAICSARRIDPKTVECIDVIYGRVPDNVTEDDLRMRAERRPEPSGTT